MLFIKSILKNKIDSLIIILIIFISLTGLNIVFNLYLNSYSSSSESKKFSSLNELVDIEFTKEINRKEINNILNNISNEGINFAFAKSIDLKDELFDVRLDLHLISDTSMFNYKISKGRNIIKDDILKNEKVIVISDNYSKFFKKNGEHYFININGDDYKIVGIIDNKYSLGFYNLKAFIPYNINNNILQTTSTNQISFISNNSRDDIDSINKYSEIKKITYSKIPSETLHSNIDNITSDIKYYLILTLLCIINLSIFLIFFIQKRKNTISILRAIGYTYRKTEDFLLKQMILLALISSLIAWIFYYPFSNFFNEKFFDLGLVPSIAILIFDLVISILLVLIIKRFMFYLINKNEIQNNMNSSTNLLKKVWIKIFIIAQISLMLNYAVDTYNIYRDLNSVLNKANSIIDFNETLVIDPFSIQFDKEALDSYNIVETLNNLKEKNISTINYIYSIDSSKDVISMKNELKENYDYNYSGSTFHLVNNSNVLPLLYIENTAFNLLKIKFPMNEQLDNNKSNIIPVYAGYDYKEFFEVGDEIYGDSDLVYKIIGFIDKNQNMFSTNNSSEIMGKFNNLNSFLIIPFDMNKLDKIIIPNLNTEEKLFNITTNTMIKYNNNEDRKFIEKILSEKNINTISLDTQLKKFNFVNFNFLRYKFFNSLMISVIALIGIICYVISSIYSEKRDIGIKRALGFKVSSIILGYLCKISILLLVSSILVIIIKYINPYSKFTYSTFLTILFISLIIIMVSLVVLIHYIRKYKISELIREES